jgi:hypothetical protein
MITLITSPAAYSSGHNNLFYVVSSDNTAQPVFKYLFDVYIGVDLVARIKVYPDDNDLGVLNLKRIASAYFTNQYFESTGDVITGITADGYFSKSLQVKIGEEYDYTMYTDLVTAPAITVYNYYNAVTPVNTTNLLTQYADKFLTTRPLLDKSTSDEYLYTSYFNPSGGSTDVTIRSYDTDGAMIGEQTTSFTHTLAQIGYGIKNLQNSYPTLVTDDLWFYTIRIGTETLKVFKTCNKFTQHYNLVFLNKLGGWDTYSFRYKSQRTIRIDKKTCARMDYRVTAGGDVLNYDYSDISHGTVYRGDQQVYAVDQKTLFRLNTDTLTDHENKWLHELIASPLVYIALHRKNTETATVSTLTPDTENTLLDENGDPVLDENGDPITLSDSNPVTTSITNQTSVIPAYIPVKITNDNYDYRMRQSQGLTALELEVELLQHFNSQNA